MTLRCPECRSRRTTLQLMVAHVRATHHALCPCGGYHFKHRPGSPCCDSHPRGAMNRAMRAGADDEELLDIAAGMAWDGPGRVGSCPF